MGDNGKMVVATLVPINEISTTAYILIENSTLINKICKLFDCFNK